MVWICPKCGSLSLRETEGACKDCGTPLIRTQTPADEVRSYMEATDRTQFRTWLENVKEKYVIGYERKPAEKSQKVDMSQYVPKCPTCGCPYIRRLEPHENSFRLANGSGNAHLACKTFICLNCGYAW